MAQKDRALGEELNKYVYDIQTVEFISTFSEEGAAQAKELEKKKESGDDENEGKKLKDDFMEEYIGPSIEDVNIQSTSIEVVRGLLSDYSEMESKLEHRLQVN